MRVLQIVPDLSNDDGITNVLMKYLRSFDKKKIIYDFMCFSSDPDNNRKNYFKAEIEAMGGKVFYISSPLNPISFFKEWREFCSNNYGNYDFLENNLVFLGAFFKNAKKLLGVSKVITHSHVTKFGDSFISNIRNKTFYYMTGAILGDVLFSSSKLAGKEMFRKKINEKPWFVVNNAFNVEEYKFNMGKRSFIRDKMNWNNKFVIGHVGRFTSQKNHKFIIKLYKRYLSFNQNSILVLVGDGKLKPKIESYVNRKNLQNNVFFLGIRNDIPTLLQGFDLFLFPSKFEGLGLSVVEAQIAGLPCLISDRVPEEADISGCSILSLNDTMNAWLHELIILQNEKRLTNGSQLAKKYGFDICIESERLYRIYKNR